MFMIITTAYGDVRISGVRTYGRLEFRRHNNSWGAVCSTGFDNNAALVACQQLGYDKGYFYIRSHFYE